MLQRRVFSRAALALGLAAVVGGLMGCGQDKPAFRAVDITGADYAQGWELSDQDGQVRTLKDFAGKAVVVFFGFTQCPDVCPTALQEMAQAKQLLGADGARLQGIFITVDPERDTSELLKAYMANFGPDFVALRPTLEQLPQVTKDFKIYYKKVEGKTPTSYTMDHSAGSFTFDPQGRIRLYNRHASGAEALAADVKILLSGK
ncbi:SCO family protein [Limnohabitans sp. Hippo3]|uniref:SCO family protein n=1 Tax=Limnohabitans sp. Hippo3 TaxID=1597956 RepID=UPI000D3BE0A8|nr:SCO family protein [Limnohabitans sp. Hippo3]PUE42021.1 SCO family protein [Limnohabitans sp. Hippo3]